MASALKASLAAATLFALLPAGQAADDVSRAELEAQEDHIEAQYDSDRKACERLSGNAKDICVAEAKGRQKVSRAELEHARSGKDAGKLATARAEAEYEIARERCDELAGNAKDVCLKEAKAAETQAKANLVRGDDLAGAREAQREANYEAARERCDALAGDAREDCVDAARRQFGKD